ncbi:hypothetical protein GMSM_25850 [Geomonas sp. Red276]
MAKLRFDDYMKAVFAPIVGTTKLNRSLAVLKTAPLPPEELVTQIRRLHSLEILDGGAVQLHNGDFIVRFTCEGETYLAVSVDNISNDDKGHIISIFENDDLALCEFEACYFLFLCHQLKDIYKIKPYLSAEAIVEMLNLSDVEFAQGYAGHDIDDVKMVYNELLFFKIPNDSLYLEKSDWYITARLALSNKNFRSVLVTDNVLTCAESLSGLSNINPENIYLSLTSVHWKHCFLEIYRCIEAIYYLPWMVELKQNSKSPCNAVELAKICHNVGWREREVDSITKLFSILPFSVIHDMELNGLSALSGIVIADDEESMRALGRRLYKIRNECVHQEDYEDLVKTNTSISCWQNLTELLYKVVYYFYTKYSSEITYTY